MFVNIPRRLYRFYRAVWFRDCKRFYHLHTFIQTRYIGLIAFMLQRINRFSRRHINIIRQYIGKHSWHFSLHMTVGLMTSFTWTLVKVAITSEQKWWMNRCIVVGVIWKIPVVWIPWAFNGIPKRLTERNIIMYSEELNPGCDDEFYFDQGTCKQW